MGKCPREMYQERLKRFNDAVSLQKPDRVPIASLVEYFVTRYAGLSDKEALYDWEKAADAYKSFAVRFNWDMAPTPQNMMRPVNVWEVIGYTQWKWPGYNLPDNIPLQFVEDEYMLADEYDEFLRNPGDFTVRKLLPRISGVLAPLAKLPPLQAMFPAFYVFLPSVKETMRTLMQAATEFEKWTAFHVKLVKELEEAGYPVLRGAVSSACLAPFDRVMDFLRGMRGTMRDMYRCPDKLLAAIDIFTDIAIEAGLAEARLGDNRQVFVPLHRGSAGFMSNEQFSRFYWPSLKKMLIAFTDAGLMPLVFFEGDYTPRLEFLAELPRGKIAAHFDVVDLEKCREILGDTMCFWGNVPAALLVTGTPQQVKDYVRKLIDIFGDTGGLIVDGAVCGVPNESKPENVEAMTEAVFQFGVYH